MAQDRTGATGTGAGLSSSTAWTAETRAAQTALMDQPPLLADPSEFVMLRRPHSELRVVAGDETPNGDVLKSHARAMSCSSGGWFRTTPRST